MRTLPNTPTTFLLLRLQSKLDFVREVGTQIKPYFEQNLPRNLSFKMVPKENTLLVGCTNIHIVYENIVLPSYHSFVTAVEEKT